MLWKIKREKVVLIAKCKYWVFPQVGADHPGCKIVTHPLSLFALSTAREMSFCVCETSPTTINTHTQTRYVSLHADTSGSPNLVFALWENRAMKTWRRRLRGSEIECLTPCLSCCCKVPGVLIQAALVWCESFLTRQESKRAANWAGRHCSCSVWQTQTPPCVLQAGVKYFSGMWQIPFASLTAITCRTSYET